MMGDIGDPFLVFLLKPPPDVADEIDFVRRKLGLDRSYSTDRLHVTVQPLGPCRLLSEETIEDAKAAAAALAHAPFHLVFDRVNDGKLEGSEPLRGFLAFRAAFQRALSARFSYPKHRSPPHVTLVYGGATGSFYVDAISWRVEEFLLVESLQGKGRHIERGCWKLRG